MSIQHTKMFQFSTITSLAAGNFDGVISFEELLKNGDFGLGTFDHLDGELVVLDGIPYQLKADGKVYPASLNDTTPFALVTFFESHNEFKIIDSINNEKLQNKIISNIPSLNLSYGIKITGYFSKIITRTVSRQEKPYPILLQATANQAVNTEENVKGTIVGFWTPSFESSINVSGFHFHFITEDKNSGGHVFDLELKEGIVEICNLSKLDLELPTNDEYLNLKLDNKNLQAELELAEKAKK